VDAVSRLQRTKLRMADRIKPGWRTSEHWLAIAAIVLAIILIIGARDEWQKRIATASVPATAGIYAISRSKLKAAAIAAGEDIVTTTATTSTTTSITSFIQNFDWSAPEASIDALVEGYVASLFPSEASLQPESNAAQAAVIALIGKVLQVYALSKVSGLLAPKLASLATEFPVAAPAITDIQKLLGLA
jgi:hypothetical protein